MTPWLLLVLLSVTTARVTRLLVADAFPPIAVARARLLQRWSPNSWQAYLADCPWCMAPYVAAPLVALADWQYSVPGPLLFWAAAAWAGGFLNVLEQHEDEEEA